MLEPQALLPHPVRDEARMFNLVVAQQDPITPPAVKPEDEVWRDNAGSVCAYGQVFGDAHWLHLPGVASFHFFNDRSEVTAFALNSVRLESVIDAYHRTVLPMALQVRGREVLHASAIRAPHGVLALCGISETGKSTIAFGLSRRGYDLWADDAVALEIAASGVTSISLPFQIWLRPTAAELFGIGETPVSTPRMDPEPPGARSSPLLAICTLRRADIPSSAGVASPVAVRRLRRSEALI